MHSLPHAQHSSLKGTSVTKDKPPLTPDNHPQSMDFTLGLTLCIRHNRGLDKCRMTGATIIVSDRVFLLP